MHHTLTLPHHVLSARISRERYMTEEIIMLISALGLFAGGTITIYLYLNDDIQDRVLAPSIKLLLQSVSLRSASPSCAWVDHVCGCVAG